ncbi:hypothetical protein [Pseudomonas sp.]|uniref:hypothetical protein n=1 Tax=Pseudomonas sp. TaxID=306 RepID=UPI00257A6562|nr:hypothetical protein [Pseudomonas sp.]
MDYKDWRVSDPLSEVTRKERRLLLGGSVLAFFMVKAGAVPTKISALGIEFQQADQKLFWFVLSAILAYLTIVFVVYGLSDFLAWRKAIIHDEIEMQKSVYEEVRGFHLRDQYDDELGKIHNETAARNRYVYWLTLPVSILRALLEFMLPVAVGGYVAVVVFLSA